MYHPTRKQHMQEMFNGLTQSDLAAMPPFPFPRELFPPDTFPAGVQFSSESLDTLPPSVRELVETGQAGSLGLMFEASSHELQPEFESLFSMLLGGKRPGSKHTSKRNKPNGPGTMPTDVVDIDAISQNIELLSACSEEELVEKIMRGELDLGGLGLGVPSDALECFDTQTSSETESESVQSEPGHLKSEFGSAETSGGVLEAGWSPSQEGGCVSGADDSSACGVQRTILIQQVREGSELASEGSSVQEGSGRGVWSCCIGSAFRPLQCDACYLHPCGSSCKVKACTA